LGVPAAISNHLFNHRNIAEHPKTRGRRQAAGTRFSAASNAAKRAQTKPASLTQDQKDPGNSGINIGQLYKSPRMKVQIKLYQ